MTAWMKGRKAKLGARILKFEEKGRLAALDASRNSVNEPSLGWDVGSGKKYATLAGSVMQYKLTCSTFSIAPMCTTAS
jgi:hypothetical protein